MLIHHKKKDIPITVLQNQANVLARTSIFAIKDESNVKELYSVLLEKLNDEATR
jgi:hypothetical protein